MHLLNTLPQRLDPGATPTFAGLISATLTSPASTPLTLGTGTSGAAITVLSASNNVGIGTTSPGSTLTLATVDTLLKPALGLRQANALGYGYDFDTETASVGRLDLYRVSNNVRTQMMSWRQDTGNVTISSTTAGSSNAGALVVAGGGSFGNNGSASYFGGSVQIANAIISQNGNNAYITGSSTAGAFLRLQSGNATGGIDFRDSTGNNLAQYYQVTNAWSFYTPTTFSNAVTISSTGIHGILIGPSTAGAFLRLQSGNATGGIDFRDTGGNGVAQYYEATDAWSFFKPTTFSGAVTIGGNVGFYNASPVAKPTGVAVTAAAIHAALVTLNLIAA